MYNHNKAQQSKNRVHISWSILYLNLWQSICHSKYLAPQQTEADDTA